MAKLINIIKGGEGELDKRQLPLVIDEKLTMVLDLLEVDFICEYPKLRSKDRELFLKKYSLLNVQELKQAFQVSCKRLLDIVSEIVPCVGCRRSVERLFHQMKDGPGRTALYPLVVTKEGVLIFPDEVYKWPHVIGAMFHNHVSKLNSLSTSWNRSKKSSRCTLHSLDAQRYVRPPLGSGWRTLWECMVPFCKQEVATIDTAQLLSTLETYLQKHRFCTECRTKVMKAYSLLVDEPEERKGAGSCLEANVCSSSYDHNHGDHSDKYEHCSSGTAVKEKGFIPSLYAGIRRCSPNNHIHVDQRTDYIMGLILAAEPELLGNRRERHAKTLEIAQEEVLVCVGLCLYERVHRIQLRLREEQMTCQLLALVAISALSTRFQLAVEMKQGISQLELLFEEFSREDRLKQRRKQIRKLKRRRKKERKNAATINSDDLVVDDEEDIEQKNDDFESQKEEEDSDDADETEIIKCLIEKKRHNVDANSLNVKPFSRTNNDRIMKMPRNDIIISKNLEKKEDSCYCSKYNNTGKSSSKSKESNRIKSTVVEQSHSRLLETNREMSSQDIYSTDLSTTIKVVGGKLEDLKSSSLNISDGCRQVDDSSDTCSSSSTSSIYSKYNDKDNASHKCETNRNSGSNHNKVTNSNSDAIVGLSCDYCANAHNDCGYGSADNNIISSNGSDASSVESSEMACSEGFCNHDGLEDCNFEARINGASEAERNVKRKCPNYDQIKNSIVILNSASRNLQHMVKDAFFTERGEITERDEIDDQRNIPECTIPEEEILRYKSSVGSINEEREQLRRTLRNKFALLCSTHRFPAT